MLQQRNTKTKVLAIISIIIGVVILFSSISDTYQMSTFYIGDIYSSSITFLFGVLFGKLGWGIHFGITLLLIGLKLLKPLKISRNSDEVNPSVNETAIEHEQNYMSVIEWFGTLVLIAIPIVNVIMLFIWAFGSDNEKKNYSLATLLTALVASVIAVGIVIATSF